MTSQLSVLKSIKKAFSLFLLLFLLQNSGKGQTNPYNSLLPSFPVSYTESSFAPFINPVFSDVSPNPSVSYIIQNLDYEKNSNHYFYADYAGFIFSYFRVNNVFEVNSSSQQSSNANLFTIGKGLFFDNSFGFGANYSFSKSDNENFDEYKSFTLGLLWRPSDFLSLGYVARDINNPKINRNDTDRSDIYSLSIRLFNAITFSVDAIKYQHQKFEKSDILLSANLAIKYKIFAFASVNKDKDFTFGLSLPFGIQSASLIIDGYASNSSDIRSSAMGLTLTSEKSRSPLIQSKRMLKININGGISEVKRESLLGAGKLTFYDLVSSIEKAKTDESIAGIILVIDSADIGFAQIQELREQIKIFKSGDKGIFAILNSMGNKEYYLASACTKIFYNPANLFSLTGLSAEVYFFKEGLEKIGIKFESVSKGAYKSYAEPFTREHMSPEFRENMISLISDLNEQYLNSIVSDRSVTRNQVNELLNKGLLKPDEALQKGFIDEINYPIDAVRKITEKNNSLNYTVTLNDYIEEKVRDHEWGPKPEIAIIHVAGSIIRGESKDFNYISGEMIGDETYFNALNDTFKDPNVKAIIIRIDSGGGSSLASELMWHYLADLKREYKKPVIFSFGNTAASGGYYIACTGDPILGNKGTITGSIGVITGKLSLKELYKKLGINKDIIKMSEFADIFSEAKDLSPEERRIIEQGVNYVYSRFTQKVIESRGIIKEQIDKIAEGRVFTGSQARDNRLIDEYGGLIAAIDLAKKITYIKNEYTVRHLPEVSIPLMNFLGLNTIDTLLSEKLKTFLKTLDIIRFDDELASYYCPYRIVIK